MATEPMTGARYPASTDSPAGYQQIQNAVFDLAGRSVPIYANASARTSAVNAWIASGKSLIEGHTCYMQDDDRLWRYDGSAWVWPKAAQGEMAYVERITAAGPIAGSTFTTISGLSTSITIPSTRKIKASVHGVVVSDVANTVVGLRIQNATSANTGAGTHEIQVANAGEEMSLLLREQLTAGTYSYNVQLAQLGGTGGAFTTSERMLLLIEDIGGV